MSVGNFSDAGLGIGGLGVPPYFFTRVTAGAPGGKTTLHAVLDYDDDLPSADYDALEDPKGPIVLKNGSVPVVPLYSYTTQQSGNGSLVHIPVSTSTIHYRLLLQNAIRILAIQ